jgi:hypothetical protein
MAAVKEMTKNMFRKIKKNISIYIINRKNEKKNKS